MFWIDELVDACQQKNLPFVLFRPPGKSLEFWIQNSSLKTRTTMKEEGFHFCPFDKSSEVSAYVIKPDFIADSTNYTSIIEKLRSLDSASYDQRTPFAVSKKEYHTAIQKYKDLFSTEGLRKAIYSRVIPYRLGSKLNLEQWFDILIEKHPNAYLYYINLPGVGIWTGVSPEILLQYNKGKAETIALAGTQVVGQNGIKNIEWGSKEIEEHKLVADYIESIASTFNTSLTSTSVHSSVAGKVAHLRQAFTFQLDIEQCGAFIQQLHPTPALCGYPKEEAIRTINSVESHDRKYYGGYFGVMDRESLTFYVNIRCMEIIGDQAHLYVGGGITSNSIAESEWEETIAKAETLLSVLKRLNSTL